MKIGPPNRCSEQHDFRGDLISEALPFGALWYTEIPHEIGYAKFRSRSRDAVMRVYDDAGNVIKTHQQRDSSEAWALHITLCGD